MAAPVPFGRYLLLERIALGGMAELHLAKVQGAAGFERTCVVKRVLPHLAVDEGFVRMFLDEARISAQLHHPGITQVFDLGREGDDYFLAMEYLAGEDVLSISRQAKTRGLEIPVEVAAKIIASAAEALHYAHEYVDDSGRRLGIVHRDVSPSNLVVTYQGAVKVLDFGIARAEERLHSTVTQAGTIKGKAGYVAPEMYKGQPVDRRADVWALGVTLYEMLTGARLFDGDRSDEVAAKVLQAPIVPPSEKRPGIPPELDAATLRALERDPDKRFATAEELRAALERFLADRTYVPQTVQLSQFLRTLFGEERAQSRLRRGQHTAPPPVSGGTEQLREVGATTEVNAGTPGGGDFDVGPTRLDRARSGPDHAAVTHVRRTARLPLAVAGAVVVGATVTWAIISSGAGERSPVAPSGPPVATLEVDAGATLPVATGPTVDAGESAPADPSPLDAGTPATVDPLPTATPHSRPKTKERVEPGVLSVTANAPANLWIDGQPRGALPLSKFKVAPGSHLLKVANPSLGLLKTQRLVVEAGKTATWAFEFGKGKLNITVKPWADVFIDDAPAGQTPLAARDLWEGQHRVKLVGPGGEKQLVVQIEPGKTTVLRETLP